MKIKTILFAAISATFVAAPLPALAETYISNLGTRSPTSPAGSAISLMPIGPGVYQYAQSFTTGNTALAFELDSIVLSMLAMGAEGGGFELSIYDDNAAAPGSALGAALSGNASPVLGQEYTYTASGITLSASTTYWIVASNNSTTASYGWKLADEAATVTGGWATPLSFSSRSGTDAWAPYLTGIPPGSVQEALRYSLNASPVPEPGSVGLLLVGAGAAFLLKRRRS